MQEENKSGIIKWVIIGGIAFILILALVAFLVLRFAKDSPIAISIGKVLPFGEVLPDTLRSSATNTGSLDPGVRQPIPGSDMLLPLFRQITDKPIAGATVLEESGKTLVRYVLRERGTIFEFDTVSAATRQLTNTLIPQVYEAYFGNNGDTVVLRYLDRSLGYDTIKTYLSEISLPSSTQNSSDAVGEIRGKYLSDNISAVSISPDGTKLFYLLPTEVGVLGYVVQLDSIKDPKLVLESAFAEWLPQILNDGKIILTTKPSAATAGFSYLYNPTDKSMTRIAREKNGLTTLGMVSGGDVLFGENINGNATVGIYSEKGYNGDEGLVTHEQALPLTTLPEKCVWAAGGARLYCASFTNTEKKMIPDEWYQGLLSFDDTFWAVDARTTDIRLLGDPKQDVEKSLDATMPFVDRAEKFLFFTDKHTSFLWSMRIKQAPENTEGDSVTPPTIEEAGDAAGSIRK